MKKQLLFFFAILFSVYNFAQGINQPSPFEVCDDATQDGIESFDLTIKNAEILGTLNPNNHTVLYYLTQMDADTNTNPLPNIYTNISNPQTIFVRVEELSTGNANTTTLDLVVNQAAIANIPADLEVCDDDGDGFATFDLDINNQQILGNQDPNSFYVLHYLSQADADAGTNALTSPFTNFSNPQTIYATVTDYTGNCVSNVVTYNLLVNTLNINTQSYDMVACDVSYGQGIAIFDLTVYEGQITNGDANLTVSYFENLNDANNNVNPITNPTFFENINSPYFQTIYLRVDNANSGCFYVSSNTVIFLNVSEFQITQPSPLIAPDPDNDGFTSFDLTLKDDEVTAGNTGYSVSYHETITDALNNVNALQSTYNNIVQNTQTIFVRSENNVNGCFDVVQLQLITDYTPFPVNPATLEACDGSATGAVTFDLTQANPDILSNVTASEYTIAYYEVYDDALTQTNAISNTTTYISNPNLPTIYAGVTETATGDYVITTISLVINPQPIVIFDALYTICSGDTLDLAPFTTPQQNTVYQWSTGETTPSISVMQAGNYSVTITNTITGCSNTGSTTVEVGFYPVIGTANNLSSCNPNQVYDLTTTIPEILVNLDPNTHNVTFYESASDAANGINAIQNASSYSPQNNNQTITVSVSAVNNTCSSLSFFDIITGSCPVTVVCGQPVTNIFCYDNNETTQYTYTSSDGSPLQLVINGGQVENNYDELIVLDSDGTNLNGTPYGNSGDVTNLAFVSSGDTITIYVDSDGSISCQNGNYTSIAYVVSCLDTTAIPNCDAVLTTPQDLAVDVNENTDLAWTLASGYVTGYTITIGTTSGGNDVLDMVDAGNISTFDVGTLNYSTQYFVSITPYNPNGNATGCTETSFTTRADPNVILDCASGQPVNTSFCYDNNETQQYNFSSNDGSSLYIVFNSGMTENDFDELIVLDSDGTNLNTDNPYGLNADGDLAGLTFTTTGPTVTIYIESDGSVIGCTNNPIDFDVFCASNFGFIQVNAFLDDNNDGIFNGTDTPFTNGFFTYEVNDDGSVNTVNSNTGSFTIVNDVEANSYDITFQIGADYQNCFSIPTALFENVTVANGNTITIDFPLTQQMPCEDLAVYLIPFSSPRPGFNYWNDLVIENLGSTTITSGTVTFIHDPLVDYVGATPLGSGLIVTPTATGASVDFTNLLPGESRVVWFQLYTPPTVNLGEFVTSSAVYTTTANDIGLDNNVSVITQEVIGSYDPNDITESHGPEIVYDDFVTTDEYLYYTIRFQNVGTAEAIKVRIENTVNSLLDIGTIEFIRATHDVVMLQNGNQLTWTFDNINLPAQSQDDYGSNGYVYFRIKPAAGYAIGTLIPNTAEIYFDFNAPVITNTFETEFIEQSLSVEEFNSNDFAIYPNPASNIVNIKLKTALNGNASVELIDVQGKIVMQNVIDEILQLNVKNLEAGLYFVKLKQNNKQTIKKLIIE
ncbi:T9SS type A sorting domain-containing protein [Lacinutrix chionoecetis]